MTKTKHTILTSLVATTVALAVSLLFALPALASSTAVPGHAKKIASERIDTDGNGISDEGVYINGHYTSVYAYDASSAYYWDLGDGRVYTTAGIESIDDLDSETLTVCDYVINYRADFGNDPFMDTGWIQNLIKCSGYDDNNNYNYFIVHEDDPRYRGNPEWSVWGSWEYHGYVESGVGNLVKPYIEE